MGEDAAGSARVRSAGVGPAGSEIVLVATTPGCAGASLRHRDGRAVLSPIGRDSALSDRQDANWVVRAGLADRTGVSLESKNYPGSYLRHRHGAVYQEPNDASDQFAHDATYVVTEGQNGQGISLASYNYPSRFLRHYWGEIFIAACGGPEPWDDPQWWADDVSWMVKPTWTR